MTSPYREKAHVAPDHEPKQRRIGFLEAITRGANDDTGLVCMVAGVLLWTTALCASGVWLGALGAGLFFVGSCALAISIALRTAFVRGRQELLEERSREQRRER